ncbi:hypothetical protein ACFLXD_03370 [Chloroflexota bacterium]
MPPSSRADVIDKVYGFYESIGLPTILADIGLGSVSDTKLAEVSQSVCRASSPIHYEPIAITGETVLTAIRAADAEGKGRKNNP